MEHLLPSKKIYISRSTIPHAGRGVFALQQIHRGEVIEMCPVVEVWGSHQVELLKQTELHNYYFMWGNKQKDVAICLGFGSLYNHSYTPNATYKKHVKEQHIEFVALQDIDKDQEITVNYNFGNPDDTSKLWIESIPVYDPSTPTGKEL